MRGIEVGDVIGDYEVVGVLGKGGMGRVYRVRNRLTDREEAMKVVHSDMTEEADLAERFLREIRVHASLSHPNIAALHAAIRVQDQIVMILELVQGFSLEERLRNGPLPVADVLHYIDQVLSALSYAHARGVVHRDIKPANILVTEEQVAKLTDFGIATAAKENKLTLSGLAVGSLAYMPPEQIQSKPVDARSDIYSLGVTCYEAVTGMRPIRADNEYALMSAQLLQIPAPVDEVAPGVPKGLSDVIMRALAKDPLQRFQSAAEFQSALSPFKGLAIPAVPQAPPVAEIPPEQLARVESCLVRVLGPIARHVVKDAARRFSSVSDLCHCLAEEIHEPRERAAFLKSALGTITARSAERATGTSPGSGQGSPSPELLEKLERALASYIGPIAKVIVKRAAKSAATPDELYRVLSSEIVSESDRQRFLSAVRRLPA